MAISSVSGGSKNNMNDIDLDEPERLANSVERISPGIL